MREDAHDYFLNAKSRFETSQDDDDAADLFFAVRNLAHHGHEVEWDDTLQKMDALLKAELVSVNVPGVDEGIESLSVERSLAEQVALRYPALNPVLAASVTGRGVHVPDYGRERQAPWMSFGKWRSHQTGDDTRRVYVEPVCSDFPGGEFDNIVNKRVEDPNYDGQGPREIREYEQKVRGLTHPLAATKNKKALRELRASRPRPIDDPSRPDEMALQGWFIETSRHPKAYEHLLDYYHPDSPFFVKSESHGDRRIDSHAQQVVEAHLPSQTSRASDEGTVRNLVQSGEHIFDLGNRSDTERLDHMRDEIGIYSPDMMGMYEQEMRTRLYEHRYKMWLQEYEGKYPNSSLSIEDRRKVFLDHLMLEVDGVPKPYIWDRLYDDEGSPNYALPEPGHENSRAGYKQVAWSEGYNDKRNRRRALGLEALRSGLICVAPSLVDDLLLADQQLKYLKAIQRSPQEIKKYILGEGFSESVLAKNKSWRDLYFTELFEEDGKERHLDLLFQAHHDGMSGGPIPISSLNRYIQGHRLMMNTAMAKFFTNSTDTPHQADQPIIYPKQANLVKECLRYMLKTADWQKFGVREHGRREGTQVETDLHDRKPLHRKLHSRSSKAEQAGDMKPLWDWDSVHDIPKVPLETFHDLNKFIALCHDNKIINADDRLKMLLYADSLFDGARAYSMQQGRRERDFSSKRRAKNLKTMAPYIDSVWGVPVADRDATTLEREHEATPFAPTLKRLTEHGGLGYHAQDPNCVFGQWATHEMIPIRPEMLGLHDYRPIIQPDEDEYEEFITGLGPTLGEEVRRFQSGSFTKDDLRRNEGNQFPLLHERVLEMYPSFRRGTDTWSEAELAREDAEMGQHRDEREVQAAWDETTEEDIVRNAVIRHTQRLITEPGEHGIPETSIPDLVRHGSLREVLRQQLPDDVAEGSLGYLPIGPAHFTEYATTIPPWVAVNIALLEHVYPTNRRMFQALGAGPADKRGRSAIENIEARLKGLVVATNDRFSRVPPPRVDPTLAAEPGSKTGADYAYSPAFHPYWQGVVLNMASMFYIGRQDAIRNSTHYPYLAACAALNNAHNHGVTNLEDGDGSGTNTSRGDYRLSFHHRQLGKPRVLQNEALLKDFEAKHAASLWGLGGTPPLKYGLHHGEGLDGKAVIGAHLDHRTEPADIPYLKMVKDMGRPSTLQVPSIFTEHPTFYTPGKKMHDLYAILAAKRPHKRKDDPATGEAVPGLGRRYSRRRGTWVEDQPIGLQADWKDTLASQDEDWLGPHWYPLTNIRGKHVLPLDEVGSNSVDRTTIRAPVSFLRGSLTQPLEGGWSNREVQPVGSEEGYNPVPMFDMSLLEPGQRVGTDTHQTPSLADSEYAAHAVMCEECIGPDFLPTGREGGHHPSSGAPPCGVCHGSKRVGWDQEWDPETGKLKTSRSKNAQASGLYAMLHSEYLELDPRVKTKTDKNGKVWALGPHPSQLASQWAEFAMGMAPTSQNMRDAIEVVSNEAKKRFNADKPPEQDPDEPDILYRSGASPSGHHLRVRNHMNAAHALRTAWPLAKAIYAVTSGSTERDFRDKLEQYEYHNLRISPGEDESSVRSKRARIYTILKTAHDFMSGFQPKRNASLIRTLWKEIEADADPTLVEEWKGKFKDAGVLIHDDGTWDYSPYQTHSAIGRYVTTVHSGLDSHPLTTFTNEEDKDNVLGYNILERYLEHPESSVYKSLVARGYSPSAIQADMNYLVGRFPLKDFPVVESGNREDISRAKQHPAGQKDPDLWFRGVKGKTSLISPKLRTKFGRGGTRYQDDLLKRGQHSRRALAAQDWVTGQMRGEGSDDLWHQFGPLFHRGDDHLEPHGAMDIIMRDLDSKKDVNKRHSFPVHRNALSDYREADNATDKLRALTQFLFAHGYYSDVHAYGETRPIAGGQRPRMGYHHDEDSSVPSNVDFSRAKLSTHLFNPLTLRQFGVERPPPLSEVAADSFTDEDWYAHAQKTAVPTSLAPQQNRFLEFHPDALNSMLGYTLDETPSDGNNFERTPAAQDIATGADVISASMDALTDLDLLLKAEKGDSGHPVPVKAMHRVFSIDDLEYFKGLSGDWVASSWPIGERLMVTRKSNIVKARDARNEDFSLANEVKKDVRAAHDKNFLVDCLWDGKVLHIVDILESGSENMENEQTKDRVRHLRANFAATDNVSIPAPINTKRVDSEGLGRAVKDLFKEGGVKQVMLRDADSTYMKGEARHPKWLLMTKQQQLDVVVLETGGASSLLGVGPLLEEDAKKMGNRAVKFKGQHYMDVGSITKSGLREGQFITVKTSNVVCKPRNNLMIFNLHGVKYLRDSEADAADSLQTLELLSGENNQNVPHKLRVKKGSIHIEFPLGQVVYDTESIGHSFLIKSVDAPSDYMFSLAESQREYWEPLAAILLRAEEESKKSKKANVVPEPPANHDKKPKKVLKPAERILKDPKITKELITALGVLEDILKEKITWTGPKALGIDYATPVESPSGPTELSEAKNLPDHDPAHRQEKGGDCWCGAMRGQDCEQGLAHKMEDCPKFSPSSKEEDKKHIKIPV